MLNDVVIAPSPEGFRSHCRANCRGYRTNANSIKLFEVFPKVVLANMERTNSVATEQWFYV